MSNVNLKPFLIEELQHFYFVLKLWLGLQCCHKLTLSLTVGAPGLFEVCWKQLISSFTFRMWRNEVNMRKRERTRQQAEELRKMQKLFLLKAMSSPGRVREGELGGLTEFFVSQGRWWLSSLTCVVTAVPRPSPWKPGYTPPPANYPGSSNLVGRNH